MTPGRPATDARESGGSRRYELVRYASAVAVVGLVSVTAYLMFGRRELTDVVMLYLLGIVVVATRFGFRASLVCGGSSVLAYNFFFTQPYLTFAVEDFRHIITFGVMLLVAVVIATLTQRVRDQVEMARRSERRTALLYAMSRELSRTVAVEELAPIAARHIEQALDTDVAVYTTTEAKKILVEVASAGFEAPVEGDEEVIRWVLSHQKHAGKGTDAFSASRGFYVPLLLSGSDAGALGVVGLYARAEGRASEPEQQRLLDAFATLLATALERARLAKDAEHARMQVEAEQLRSTLLSSISHDLRTPLAVVRGAASTLADDETSLSTAARRELASAVLEETERLERQVRNLLDMMRLESGAVRIHKEWQSLQEVVGAAFNRVEARLASRNVTVDVSADLMAPFDGVLVEQLLVNLLENAAKYTTEGTPLEIKASNDGDNVVVVIADRGPGIPAEERDRIFDKFQRGPSDRTKGGVGLGLTICRAIATAHGGRVWVESRNGGGAAFAFAMPLEGEPPSNGGLPEIKDGSEASA